MRAIIAKSTILTSLIVILAGSIFGQKPTPTPPVTRAEDEEIRIDSKLIVIPAAVIDAAGNPVQGLSKDDFLVTEEGRPQKIEAVGTAETVPLEIALLIDVSASTGAMFEFQQQTAAKFLKSVMKPADRATIFTIGASPLLVMPRNNSEQAAEALLTIKPTKEFTAFYDSVATAAEFLMKNAPQGSRRVMVIISDGEDTNSTRIARAIQDGYRKIGSSIDTIDPKELYALTVRNRNEASKAERQRILKLLQDADTVFYSINPAGSSFQLNSISVFGQENMEKFASETGGSAFLPRFLPIDTKDDLQNIANTRKNTETLTAIFRRLESELRAQYLIQYYSDAEFPNGRFVRTEVRLRNPGSNQIRARSGYFVKN
jgi:Ca-activated chloride channel family protein